MITIKINTKPRYLYQEIENAVAFATIRVWLDMQHERLQCLTERLEAAGRETAGLKPALIWSNLTTTESML